MAPNVPTPATIGRKVQLVWLALVNPAAFDSEEAKDNAVLNAEGRHDDRSPIRKVRRALLESLLWCAAAALMGLGAAALMVSLIGKAQTAAVTAIVAGTMILLWATLALQGWEIQSIGGVRLSERVNRWIF